MPGLGTGAAATRIDTDEDAEILGLGTAVDPKRSAPAHDFVGSAAVAGPAQDRGNVPPDGDPSTTNSPGSSASPTDGPAVRPQEETVGIIACGALAYHVHRISARRGWSVRVYPLSAPLHNRPERIAQKVADLARSIRSRHAVLAVAYADCGTYGALDEICRSLGLVHLSGPHCYEVFAGTKRLADVFGAEPATYLLTDFLVRSFPRTVWQGLGLDRHPELRDDYFGNYRRVVWLAQQRTPELEAAARQAAATIGLPLTVLEIGDVGLEQALEALLKAAGMTDDALLLRPEKEPG